MALESNIPNIKTGGTEGFIPIGDSTGKSGELPSKPMGETEAKTSNVANEAGITNKGLEGRKTVILIDTGSFEASNIPAETINVENAISSVKDEVSSSASDDLKIVNSGLDEETNDEIELKRDKQDQEVLESFLGWKTGLAHESAEKLQQRIIYIREEISEAKEEFRERNTGPLEPEQEKFHTDVHNLMNTGTFDPVSGGKSGVYFLSDPEGNRRFVIKPYDEDMMTLNNPKGFATPYIDAEGICRPKQGIAMYSAAKNEVTASLIAKELGISRCTAKSEMMILKSDTFYDMTDDIEGDKEKLAEKYGAVDKEKLCVVQKFIRDCKEVGELLLDNLNLSLEEFEMMDLDERNTLEREALPKNIDQEMFEEGIILALVCGEADGNAGNYMVANQKDPSSGKFPVYKIDNAASFTDDNSSVTTGADWLLNCSETPMSDKAKSLVKNLNADNLASLMEKQGYDEECIESMHQRIEVMKANIESSKENYSIGDWVLTIEDDLKMLS